MHEDQYRICSVNPSILDPPAKWHLASWMLWREISLIAVFLAWRWTLFIKESSMLDLGCNILKILCSWLFNWHLSWQWFLPPTPLLGRWKGSRCDTIGIELWSFAFIEEGLVFMIKLVLNDQRFHQHMPRNWVEVQHPKSAPASSVPLIFLQPWPVLSHNASKKKHINCQVVWKLN